MTSTERERESAVCTCWGPKLLVAASDWHGKSFSCTFADLAVEMCAFSELPCTKATRTRAHDPNAGCKPGQPTPISFDIFKSWLAWTMLTFCDISDSFCWGLQVTFFVPGEVHIIVLSGIHFISVDWVIGSINTCLLNRHRQPVLASSTQLHTQATHARGPHRGWESSERALTRDREKDWRENSGTRIYQGGMPRNWKLEENIRKLVNRLRVGALTQLAPKRCQQIW